MTARDQTQTALARENLAPEPGEEALVHLPVIQVRTKPDEVAGFLRETGGIGTGDFVPLTFPFRWFTLPAIRSVILQLTGGEGFLPVHESQSFAYEKSLRTGIDYVLSVEIERIEKPSRLILRMAVSTGAGETCARLETVLRIVRLALETES